MKLKQTLIGAVMALGVSAACAASADAAILVATYTGTVSDGYDQTGVFGAAGASLTGDSYVAKYTFDTTKGVDYNDLPAFEELYGGSAYGTSSPVSATIIINGHTQLIEGNYLGQALTEPHYYYPYNVVEHASINYNYGVGNIFTYNYINNYLSNIPQPTVTSTVPLTNSDEVSGSLQIDTYNYNTNTQSEYAYASFDGAGTVQIGGVPEPATWAVMLLGFGGVGASIRNQRRKQAAVAA